MVVEPIHFAMSFISHKILYFLCWFAFYISGSQTFQFCGPLSHLFIFCWHLNTANNE